MKKQKKSLSNLKVNLEIKLALSRISEFKTLFKTL